MEPEAIPSGPQPGPPPPGAVLAAPNPSPAPVAAPAPAAAPAQAAPAAAPASDYNQLRRNFFRALAATGDVNTYVNLRNVFYDNEARKVQGHLNGAIAASTQGDQRAAAMQLQAAGTYLYPGVTSVVTPGPGGSFAVENYDDESGEVIGGYSMTPQNVVEYVAMLQDPQAYATFAFNRGVEMQDLALRVSAAATLEEQRRQQMETEVITQARGRVDLALSTLNLETGVATQQALIDKAEAEALTATTTAIETAATSQDRVDQAALATEQAEATLRQSEDGERSTKIDRYLATFDELSGLVDEEDTEASDAPIGMAGSTGPDPRSRSLRYKEVVTTDAEGNQTVEYVRNTELDQRIMTMGISLMEANPDADPREVAISAENLLLGENTSFRFFGGPNQAAEDERGGRQGRPRRPNSGGVIINDVPYTLRDEDMAPLERAMLESRIVAMQQAGQDPAEFVTEDGRGFSNIQKSPTQMGGAPSSMPGSGQRLGDTPNGPGSTQSMPPLGAGNTTGPTTLPVPGPGAIPVPGADAPVAQTSLIPNTAQQSVPAMDTAGALTRPVPPPAISGQPGLEPAAPDVTGRAGMPTASPGAGLEAIPTYSGPAAPVQAASGGTTASASPAQPRTPGADPVPGARPASVDPGVAQPGPMAAPAGADAPPAQVGNGVPAPVARVIQSTVRFFGANSDQARYYQAQLGKPMSRSELGNLMSRLRSDIAQLQPRPRAIAMDELRRALAELGAVAR